MTTLRESRMVKGYHSNIVSTSSYTPSLHVHVETNRANFDCYKKKTSKSKQAQQIV